MDSRDRDKKPASDQQELYVALGYVDGTLSIILDVPDRQVILTPYQVERFVIQLRQVLDMAASAPSEEQAIKENEERGGPIREWVEIETEPKAVN